MIANEKLIFCHLEKGMFINFFPADTTYLILQNTVQGMLCNLCACKWIAVFRIIMVR